MQRRLPKRGFNPLSRNEYSLVNLGQLEIFESGSKIDAGALIEAGLIKKVGDGIKVLAKGDLTKALTVKAHKFSAAAREKIAAAGGTVEER
jgi:large subunit ribosomal protein L15